MRGEVVDSYRYAASIFSKVVSDGYIGMMRTIPQVYGFMYDRAERAAVAGGFRVWAAEFTARNLRPLIQRMRPSVVVCTHAFPCNVMAAYKRLFDDTIPVMGVVTDFVAHPFWIYHNVDAYAVATPEIRRALATRGVDPERVAIDGIPVDPRFGRPPSDRAALRAALGLPADRPVALVMGGGLGLGPVASTVRALARADRVVPVVIAGKNRALQRHITDASRRDGVDVRVHGFVENVYDWMHASDVLITKPGGLTTSEALAAGIPLVLLRPLPGQEERNARYLVSHGAALGTAKTDELARAVERVLQNGRAAARLRAGAALLARPHSAESIARRVAALAGAPGRTPIAVAHATSRRVRRYCRGGTVEPPPERGAVVERWPSG